MYLDGFLCLTWGGYQRPIARAAVLSRGALPRRVRAAVAGAWVGNRVWEDGFGNWKRGWLRHTTCGVKRRGGHTSNSVISGVSGFKGFKLQRLGTFVGFGGKGCERGRGRRGGIPRSLLHGYRSGRRGRGREMALAWIGGGDDGADGLLVEAFEATVALEVLQVAAKRTFADELLNLISQRPVEGQGGGTGVRPGGRFLGPPGVAAVRCADHGWSRL